jgi:succinate dehydrogenase/fumarate reductase cytochrome b subunit
MKLRTLHRNSAILIATFTCLHIANHLVALVGIPSHIAFMEVARKLYRQPIFEIPLLVCVAFQVTSGLWLIVRRRKQRHGGLVWLQAISGVLLAFFLLVHVGAVLYGRTVLHLDTNFYFAAAGFHVPPNQFFFGPYYFLAVLALFTHIGCAAYWRFDTLPPETRKLVIAIPMLIGGTVSLLIVLLLAGKLQAFEVPAAYKATYAR